MLFTLSLLTLLNLAPAADSLNGAWQVNGDVIGNPISQVCNFKQTGIALTGSCTMEGGPALEIKGEVKEDKVVFSYVSEYDGQAITIVYAGTLTGSELKGTLTVQPFDVGGEFTAKPVPAKP